MISLTVKKETWPLKEPFAISRVTMQEVYVLAVELRRGEHVGRGECEPHETDPDVMDELAKAVENLRPAIEAGMSRAELNNLLPACPIRNALDCAMWDLEAKQAGLRAWQLAAVTMPDSLQTAYTICIGTVEEMAEKAARNRHRPLLKLKLGAEQCIERVSAVRAAAPEADIIVDANEAWSFEQLERLAPGLHALGVSLIEQPLPAGQDRALEHYRGAVPLCADESCLDRGSLPQVQKRYRYINIKLDKTGGLTEALHLAREAQALGLGIMVGCMTATSLAMAPAMLVGSMARFCDLDGPLLLADDRSPGLSYDNSTIALPPAAVWG